MKDNGRYLTFDLDVGRLGLVQRGDVLNDNTNQDEKITPGVHHPQTMATEFPILEVVEPWECENTRVQMCI